VVARLVCGARPTTCLVDPSPSRVAPRPGDGGRLTAPPPHCDPQALPRFSRHPHFTGRTVFQDPVNPQPPQMLMATVLAEPRPSSPDAPSDRPESTASQANPVRPDAVLPSLQSCTYRYKPIPFWLSVGAVAFTWPLLFVGGLVTTYGVGMAVPDWPTTFGDNMFLYDMTEAAWGVFIEHGHRLYGAAVGLCVLALTIWMVAFETRRVVLYTSLAALVAVLLQGLLGGQRVLANSTTLAMVHGGFGQATFALMVALATVTSRAWTEGGGLFQRHVAAASPPVRVSDPAGLRWLAPALVALVYGQILLGGWIRHFLDPPAFWIHGGGSFVVLTTTGLLLYQVERHRHTLKGTGLVTASRWFGAAVLGQFVLGLTVAVVLWPFDGMPHEITIPGVWTRTGHVALGAMVLGLAVVVSLLARRRLVAQSKSPDPSSCRMEGAVA